MGSDHGATLESVHHRRSHQRVTGRTVDTTSPPKNQDGLLVIVTVGLGLYFEAAPHGVPRERSNQEKEITLIVFFFLRKIFMRLKPSKISLRCFLLPGTNLELTFGDPYKTW